MRQIRIGKIVLTDGGEWNASSAYTKLTWVLHNGDAWWSTVNNIGSEPSDSNTAWVRATSVQKFIRAIQEAISDAEDLSNAIGQAEALRVDAENARVDNENQRKADNEAYKSAEEERQKEELKRESYEASRVSSEQGRVSAEKGRANSETIRQQTFERAITNVETATQLAGNAASSANDKAVYAKEQGDYAKAQGDAAVAIINENVDKVNSFEASIEGILNILEEQGHVHAQTLDIDSLPTICTFPLFRIEEKDPDVTPDFIGQIWINKAGNTVYIATHCDSAAGYKAI